MDTQIRTTKEKLQRAKVRMQQDYPFFASIVMYFMINPKNDNSDNMPTMAVDKRGNLYYNDKFVESLSPAELVGVLAHEVMHVCNGSFLRLNKREPFLWNIATDCAINFMLVTNNFSLPKEGLIPSSNGDVKLGNKTYNVAGKTSEEIYEMLQDDKKNNKFLQQGDGDPKGGQKQKGKGDGSGGDSWDMGKTFRKGGFDQHIYDDAPPSENSQVESEWKKKTVEAATYAKMRGNLPGFAQDLVDQILNPVVDWRKVIRKYITNEIPVDFTNRVPSRKYYGTGAWSPNILRENVEVFVSIDVSGSTMGEREYFLSEVFGILNSYHQVKARLIFWDTRVNPENDFLITSNNRDELLQRSIKDCNGGTEFGCYAKYIQEKGYRSRIHIVMTDGYIEHNPDMPSGNCVFVLSKNSSDEVVKDLGLVCKLGDVED